LLHPPLIRVNGVGEARGREGVKLEEQVPITGTGPVKLSRFAFGRHLMATLRV